MTLNLEPLRAAARMEADPEVRERRLTEIDGLEKNILEGNEKIAKPRDQLNNPPKLPESSFYGFIFRLAFVLFFFVTLMRAKHLLGLSHNETFILAISLALLTVAVVAGLGYFRFHREGKSTRNSGPKL
jgi:hypothetical protein